MSDSLSTARKIIQSGEALSATNAEIRAMAQAHLASAEREKRLHASLEWAMDEIDVLSNLLVRFAYPQGMAMLGREEQFDKYRAACLARAALEEEEAQK